MVSINRESKSHLIDRWCTGINYLFDGLCGWGAVRAWGDLNLLSTIYCLVEQWSWWWIKESHTHKHRSICSRRRMDSLRWERERERHTHKSKEDIRVVRSPEGGCSLRSPFCWVTFLTFSASLSPVPRGEKEMKKKSEIWTGKREWASQVKAKMTPEIVATIIFLLPKTQNEIWCSEEMRRQGESKIVSPSYCIESSSHWCLVYQLVSLSLSLFTQAHFKSPVDGSGKKRSKRRVRESRQRREAK